MSAVARVAAWLVFCLFAVVRAYDGRARIALIAVVIVLALGQLAFDARRSFRRSTEERATDEV